MHDRGVVQPEDRFRTVWGDSGRWTWPVWGGGNCARGLRSRLISRQGCSGGRVIKRGRVARFEPTTEQVNVVKVMAACGITHEAIAGAIGIGVKQLKRSFGKVMKTAKDLANGKVANALFDSAIGSDKRAPNVLAQMFWLKTQAGWLEAEHQQAKQRDAMIEQEIARVAMHGLKLLEPSELIELRRLLTKVGCTEITPAANDAAAQPLQAVS